MSVAETRAERKDAAFVSAIESKDGGRRGEFPPAARLRERIS